MIVVDTSALVAISFGEPMAAACMAALDSGDELVISAATLAEALIVIARRHHTSDFSSIIDTLSLDVVPVNEATARAVGNAYARWGKSFHAAALNYGDCFAYVLAKERDCPLLFVGNDFAQTDVRSAL